MQPISNKTLTNLNNDLDDLTVVLNNFREIAILMWFVSNAFELYPEIFGNVGLEPTLLRPKI